MNLRFSAPRGIGGVMTPPADKSITHRALLLAAGILALVLIDHALGDGGTVDGRHGLLRTDRNRCEEGGGERQ